MKVFPYKFKIRDHQNMIHVTAKSCVEDDKHNCSIGYDGDDQVDLKLILPLLEIAFNELLQRIVTKGKIEGIEVTETTIC